MAEALINPIILTWARERAGFAVDEIAKKLNIKPENFLLWEQGKKKPTFKQAQSFAQKTFIPFGYLYLQTPPEEEILLPDLRTIGDHPLNQYSLELKDTLRMTLERQEWYREYSLLNEHPPLTWVDSQILGNFKEALATLNELLNEREKRLRNFEDYYALLRKKIESLGVLVMRNSVVGNNTHRPLNRNEFRGFAISDNHAPVIFINASDTPQAQIFTLLHEFAHLLLGESGVSDLAPYNTHSVEKFCNKLAAEFLVPSQEFAAQWQLDIDIWQRNLPELAQHFHVSQWVIARRALEHGFISSDEYWTHYSKILEHFKKEKAKGDGGPTFNRLIKMRYSSNLANAVASEALSGRMLLRDAARLIGVRPENIKQFAMAELGF